MAQYVLIAEASAYLTFGFLVLELEFDISGPFISQRYGPEMQIPNL